VRTVPPGLGNGRDEERSSVLSQGRETASLGGTLPRTRAAQTGQAERQAVEEKRPEIYSQNQREALKNPSFGREIELLAESGAV